MEKKHFTWHISTANCFTEITDDLQTILTMTNQIKQTDDQLAVLSQVASNVGCCCSYQAKKEKEWKMRPGPMEKHQNSQFANASSGAGLICRSKRDQITESLVFGRQEPSTAL